MSAISSPLLACELQHGVLIAQFVRSSVVSESVVCEAERMVLERLPEAKRGVVVDCSQLTGHVTSRLLNMLVSIRNKAKKRGTPFAISGLDGFLEQVFTISRLENILDTYPTLADAVADFGEFNRHERAVVELRKSRRASKRPRPLQKFYEKHKLLVQLAAAVLAVVTGTLWWSAHQMRVPDVQPNRPYLDEGFE